MVAFSQKKYIHSNKDQPEWLSYLTFAAVACICIVTCTKLMCDLKLTVRKTNIFLWVSTHSRYIHTHSASSHRFNSRGSWGGVWGVEALHSTRAAASHWKHLGSLICPPPSSVTTLSIRRLDLRDQADPALCTVTMWHHSHTVICNRQYTGQFKSHF